MAAERAVDLTGLRQDDYGEEFARDAPGLGHARSAGRRGRVCRGTFKGSGGERVGADERNDEEIRGGEAQPQRQAGCRT
jgi:hypothetical protein